MEKYRCFISIDFSQNVIQQILLLQKDFKMLKFHSIRWIPEKNLHLTLKFLGDVPQEIIPSIEESLDHLSSDYPSFKLKISKMGVFPHWNNPRILWLGFENSRELFFLAKKIEAEMSTFGFTPEERDFTPHLTIARIKDRLPLNETGQLKQACSTKINEIPILEVNKINLYRSFLKPTGAEYSLMHSSFLKK